MTDNAIEFEGGDVFANLGDRTITGLLIPFGEEGRTNVVDVQADHGGVGGELDGAGLDHEPAHVRPALFAERDE